MGVADKVVADYRGGHAGEVYKLSRQNGEGAGSGLLVLLVVSDEGGYQRVDLNKGKQTECYKKPYSVLDSWQLANKYRKVIKKKKRKKKKKNVFGHTKVVYPAKIIRKLVRSQTGVCENIIHGTCKILVYSHILSDQPRKAHSVTASRGDGGNRQGNDTSSSIPKCGI